MSNSSTHDQSAATSESTLCTGQNNKVLWLQLTSGASLLVLMLATLPLWWTFGPRGFPQIPAFASIIPLAEALDEVAVGSLAILVLAATLTAAVRLSGRESVLLGRLGGGLWLAVFATSITVAAFDQFRWQPWFYQFGIYSLLFACAQATRCIRLMQLVVVGIYFYSAAGKLDYQFVHTVGQDFLQVVLLWVGQDPSDLSQATSVRMAFVFPVLELALSGLLAASFAGWPTRRFACAMAIIFHLGLACVFSPLGLGHSLGVILWNLQFAVQTPLLFSSSQREHLTDAEPNQRITAWAANRLALLVVVAVCSLPLVERFGLWDHWTSWALYSPHSSRAEVLVATSAVDQLPTQLREIMQNNASEASAAAATDDAAFEALWTQVPIEQWCLEVNRAPLLPQSRSGVALARFLCEVLQSEYKVQVRVRSVSGRFDGRRKVTQVANFDELKRMSKSFWLNTEPSFTPNAVSESR